MNIENLQKEINELNKLYYDESYEESYNKEHKEDENSLFSASKFAIEITVDKVILKMHTTIQKQVSNEFYMYDYIKFFEGDYGEFIAILKFLKNSEIIEKYRHITVEELESNGFIELSEIEVDYIRSKWEERQYIHEDLYFDEDFNLRME